MEWRRRREKQRGKQIVKEKQSDTKHRDWLIGAVSLSLFEVSLSIFECEKRHFRDSFIKFFDAQECFSNEQTANSRMNGTFVSMAQCGKKRRAERGLKIPSWISKM